MPPLRRGVLGFLEKDVLPAAADEFVFAGPADEAVVARAAVEEVVGVAGGEGIVAAVAEEGSSDVGVVGVPAAGDRVGDDLVIPLAAADEHGAAPYRHRR